MANTTKWNNLVKSILWLQEHVPDIELEENFLSKLTKDQRRLYLLITSGEVSCCADAIEKIYYGAKSSASAATGLCSRLHAAVLLTASRYKNELSR